MVLCVEDDGKTGHGGDKQRLCSCLDGDAVYEMGNRRGYRFQGSENAVGIVKSVLQTLIWSCP